MIHTPPLFQVELEKDGWGRWTYYGVPRTLDYPTVNLNPCWKDSAPYDHNARPSHTDEH